LKNVSNNEKHWKKGILTMSIPVIAGATGAIHNENMNKDVDVNTDKLMDLLNIVETNYCIMLNHIDWKTAYLNNKHKLTSQYMKDFDNFKDELFKVLLNK
jgi:hypothetical protein